ncbi:MAG: peptidase S10 [Cyclobacteriaceae bacterium]|nr:peptidase S10 [Cyclobacteriaceae bacterium]MCH8517238.1 peptidase S10 [Cyclobacteriaceae bacterium]
MKNYLLILALIVPFGLFAQDHDKIKEEDPEVSVTTHKVSTPSGTINYTATAGHMIIRDEDGYSRAKVFYMAYTKGDKVDTNRPVTFAFNGGPGSSSVWLHMGALGPKRVVMTEKGDQTKPPFEIVDNEYTWLDETDLVFIDPIETGYSRPAQGVSKKEFLGYNEDIQIVGDFIRKYTTQEGRWSSPKFLAGESYGTTRAAGLSGYLQDRYGMYLNGMMLISAILNFQTAYFTDGNELPYSLFLPTYAAIAWYHDKIDKNKYPELRPFLDEVEKFAEEDYTVALMKGDRLKGDDYKKIQKQLSEFTGLSEEWLESAHLRINIQRFVKELRRDEGITVGRLDGRITSFDYDNAGERYEYDPSYNAAIFGPYTAAIHQHLHDNLKVKKDDLPYEILTGRVRPWNYNNVQNQFLNNSQTLRQAIHKNPSLKVIVTNGYYDLATPYFATEYTFDHMFLNEAFKDNISMTYYEAGHMMYIHKPSLEQFTDDIRKFLKESK